MNFSLEADSLGRCCLNLEIFTVTVSSSPASVTKAAFISTSRKIILDLGIFISSHEGSPSPFVLPSSGPLRDGLLCSSALLNISRGATKRERVQDLSYMQAPLHAHTTFTVKS